jgi:hypothetical protein
VPLFTHAQKDEAQHRLAIALTRRKPAELLARRGRRFLRRLLAPQPVNAVLRNPQRRQQRFARQPEIALRIVRRNATLIAPKKSMLPRDEWRAFAMLAAAEKNRPAIRPPDSATP